MNKKAKETTSEIKQLTYLYAKQLEVLLKKSHDYCSEMQLEEILRLSKETANWLELRGY